MKRACVVGWPIAHSRSPLIHGSWLAAYGIDGTYTREAVEPGAVADFLGSLGARGFVGCNVTVPHKEAAFAAAQVVEPSAFAVGAANTIWLQNGLLHAANTDTYGFMTHLALAAPAWAQRQGPVSILGAGGAARAIVFGFLEAGVTDIRVFNRSRERADALARSFGPRVTAYDWADRSAASMEASVLVNTTSVGLNGEGDLGIEFCGFHPACVVADIVYVPLETGLLQAARRHGLVTVDGLGMLLHQAVPGFEHWFGVRPVVTDELRNRVVADIMGWTC